MENGLEGVFLRLVYVLRETKELKNSTIILGAGCSLNSTDRDISTWGIMKQCLLEHGVDNLDDIGWEELYTKLAGIERNITPHMFRHSFATYLIEEGVDVSCVQQILGHSSIKTTQIYIHIASKKQAEILREMHPRNRMNIIRAA
jgi:hypothetical protein